MQPVLRYQAQTYPPRGPQWPQFDEQLGLVASVTDTLHYGLSQKREAKHEMHSDRLQYHGLAPKDKLLASAPEHYSIASEAGEPEFEEVMEEAEQEAEQEEPSRTSRVMAGTKSAIKNYAWPFTKALLGASGEAAVMAVKHGVPVVAKAVVGGASAVASLASGSDDLVEDTASSPSQTRWRSVGSPSITAKTWTSGGVRAPTSSGRRCACEIRVNEGTGPSRARTSWWV